MQNDIITALNILYKEEWQHKVKDKYCECIVKEFKKKNSEVWNHATELI